MATRFGKILPFLALFPCVSLSIILLVADRYLWTLNENLAKLVATNRATTQLLVQIVANILGLADISAICRIVNFNTRIMLSTRSMSTTSLNFWTAFLSQQFTIEIPTRLVLPLILWLLFEILPSALWAGALTPVTIIVTQKAQIKLPDYTNTTLLNYNWSSRSNLPAVRNKDGIFAYNVGETFLGELLQAASQATTVDGGTGLRPKLDYTSFVYVNRSYGVGMSVGVTDEDIRNNPRARSYWYLETGYRATVECIYNGSTAYHIESGGQERVWEAKGLLPNSLSPEEASYFGWSGDTIVAIAAASATEVPGRILGIAAGAVYENLNRTQCETFYTPTILNVSVELGGMNITVTPIDSSNTVQDIEPHGNLTFLVNWQVPLIASDQTSFYSSLVGNSFNTSISNYMSSQLLLHNVTPSTENSSLRGLENSITAMVESMLTAYAGAQVMVAKETFFADAYVGVEAVRLGGFNYIVAVMVLNFLFLCILCADALRTKGWQALKDFNFMKPTDILLGVAAECDNKFKGWKDDAAWQHWRISHRGEELLLSKNSMSTSKSSSYEPVQQLD